MNLEKMTDKLLDLLAVLDRRTMVLIACDCANHEVQNAMPDAVSSPHRRAADKAIATAILWACGLKTGRAVRAAHKAAELAYIRALEDGTPGAAVAALHAAGFAAEACFADGPTEATVDAVDAACLSAAGVAAVEGGQDADHTHSVYCLTRNRCLLVAAIRARESMVLGEAKPSGDVS